MTDDLDTLTDDALCRLIATEVLKWTFVEDSVYDGHRNEDTTYWRGAHKYDTHFHDRPLHFTMDILLPLLREWYVESRWCMNDRVEVTISQTGSGEYDFYRASAGRDQFTRALMLVLIRKARGSKS